MRHFLAIADHSSEELDHLLTLALELKQERSNGGNKPLLKGKTLGMVFQKPSLRTRVSFEVGMMHLSGDALYLSPNEIGLGGRESVADVARVLSGYVDAIMARTFSHQHILDLAKYANVPVINGLTDYNHPCQALADALTIREKFGTLRGLRVAYVGDGNNVAVSLAHICARLGADFVLATPPDYRMAREPAALAQKLSEEGDTRFEELTDPAEAVKDAHVVYTDTWTSMGQEAETEKRQKVFPPYQVNAALLQGANKDCIVMHCLPAHRGQEITDEVMDGPQSVVFPQAENRLHAQKAVLVKVMTG